LDFAFNPNSLSSFWFDFIQSLYIYEASTILSTLETDLRYWVIVGCGAEEETEGYVQIVGETECRILQGERERVEDLNIFLSFLFMGIHS
jgi:hypothetical protein